MKTRTFAGAIPRLLFGIYYNISARHVFGQHKICDAVCPAKNMNMHLTFYHSK